MLMKIAQSNFWLVVEKEHLFALAMGSSNSLELKCHISEPARWLVLSRACDATSHARGFHDTLSVCSSSLASAPISAVSTR
eukprot:6192536-Karenia_brevis.AAC.1